MVSEERWRYRTALLTDPDWEQGWVPVDRNARKEVRKKERAAKMARAEEMQKQRAAEVAQQRAEMKEAFEKAKEARKAKRESEQK